MYSIAILVLAAVAASITYFIIPFLKSKTTKAERESVLQMVEIAVAAAEQMFTGSGRGTEKKSFVLEWLEQRNITLDYKVLDTMIESAVYALKEDSRTVSSVKQK